MGKGGSFHPNCECLGQMKTDLVVAASNEVSSRRSMLIVTYPSGMAHCTNISPCKNWELTGVQDAKIQHGVSKAKWHSIRLLKSPSPSIYILCSQGLTMQFMPNPLPQNAFFWIILGFHTIRSTGRSQAHLPSHQNQSKGGWDTKDSSALTV